MMGYQAKWVWSIPQMTLMKCNPQITQMTQSFGCEDSPCESAAIGHKRTTKMAQREDADEPRGRRPQQEFKVQSSKFKLLQIAVLLYTSGRIQ
jgi:hypothetical protein